MPQLAQEEAPLGLHCLHHWLPALNLLLAVDAWHLRVAAAATAAWRSSMVQQHGVATQGEQ
jgi:hypothetical protein